MRRLKNIIIVTIIFLILINIALFIILFLDSKDKEKAKNKTDTQSETTTQAETTTSELSEESVVSEDSNNKEQDEAMQATAQDAEDESTDFELKMSFVGDCCMSTNIDEIVEGSLLWYEQNYPNSYFFEKVIGYFEDDDLTVANCENAFSDQNLSPKEKEGETNYWFKSPARFASVFKDNSIEAVSIANNHSGDFGTQGYEDTKAALEYAGVRWGDESNAIYFEKNGYTVSVVCANMFSYAQGENILNLLEEAKGKSDFQVVFFHGGLEGEFETEGWIVDICHRLVDGGADLVVGAHPHVLRQRETYNNVDIVYSLGNFCFGGNINPKPNRTIIYRYNLKLHRDVDGSSNNSDNSAGKVELVDKEEEIIPCYIYTGGVNNWQPAPIESADEAQRVKRFMDGELSTPE